MALQHLRSSTAHKRPIPTVMSAGQIAINTNEASPGLFFKDSNGDLVKVGPVHIGTTAPNANPATTAATALVAGTIYQILTVGTTDFTLVGAGNNNVGTVFTATGAGTGTGTVSGQQGVEKGEQWLDTTGGAYDLKIYDGTSWRSQAGEFVNVTGDTMTGALLLDNAASASAPDLSFDGDANTGIYSPGADQVAISTGGTGRLFVDSSGDVGVGTSSVSSPGSYGKTVQVSSGDSSSVVLSRTNATAHSLEIGVFSGASLIESTGATSLRLKTNGSEAMRIDSSGRLGVGTSSPSNKLDVLSTTAGTTVNARVGSVAATGANNANLIINNGGTGDATLRFDYESNTNRASIGTSASTQALIFKTAGDNERLRIDSSGNVGIGGAATNTASTTTLQVTDGTTARMLLESTGAGGRKYGWYASTDGQFAVYDYTASSERMRIDSSGRVGIKTSSMGSLYSGGDDLVVGDGGGSNQGITIFTGTGNQGIITFADGFTGAAQQYAGYLLYDHTDDRMTFATSGQERMRINSSGNLGVGTTSPGQRLTVATSSGNCYIEAKRASKSTGQVALALRGGTSGADCILYQNTNSDDLRFYVNGSDRAAIDSSGNLGVGTTSPSSLLHLSSASSPALKLQDTTNDCTLLLYSQNTNSHIGTSSNHELFFDTNGSQRMMITTAGNVGIGTSSPSAKLHVSSTAGVEALVSGGGTSGDTVLHLKGNGNAFKFIVPNSASQYGMGLYDVSNTAYRMFVNSSGNVGIGTTSPSQPLTVNGIARFENFIEFGGSISTPATAASIYRPADNNLAFGTASTERMRIDSSGDVEIMQGNNLTWVYAGGSTHRARIRAESSDDLIFENGSGNAERMRIDSSGRLLVGTSSTQADTYLVVEGQSGAATGPGTITLARGSNTPGDGNGIGQIFFTDTNHTLSQAIPKSAASILCQRDGGTWTSGSSMPGRLVFSTTADGASSPTERVRITSNSDGHLLIANTNPANSSDTGIKLKGGSASTVDVVINAATNINLNHVYNTNATNNGYRYYLSADGGIRNFSSNNSNLCDEREKKNIAALEDKWDKVKSWELKKFHYIGEPDTDDLRYGVIAQQVETECPEVLTSWLKQEAREAQLDEDGNVVTPAQEQILRKGVKEQQMMWMAIKALQEAQTRIETLEAKVAALEAS